MGRQARVTDALGTRTFAYTNTLEPVGETVEGAYSRTLARTHDGLVRPTGFSLDTWLAATYGYDAMGRFHTIGASLDGESLSFTYGYVTNSDLLAGWSGEGLTVAKSYDANRNLLTQVKNTAAGATVSQYDYANDALGRRTSVKNSGLAFSQIPDAFTLYGYNDRSELTSAGRYFGTDLGQTNTPVGLQSLG